MATKKKVEKTQEEVVLNPFQDVEKVHDKCSQLVDEYEAKMFSQLNDEAAKEKLNESLTKAVTNMVDLSYMMVTPMMKYACAMQVAACRYWLAQMKKAEEMFVVA